MGPDLWRFALVLIQLGLVAIQLWLVARAHRDYKRADKLFARARALVDREPPPEGPEGVSVRYADGQVYEDLPTVFVGYDHDGVARFEVMLPRDLAAGPPVALRARVLPPMTAVGFALRHLE